MKTSRSLIILIIVAGILLIPLIAMQFSTEVVWTASDFIIMGILLLLTGVAINLVLSRISSTQNRLIISGIILAVFFVILAELAVGLFGSPFAGS